MRLHLDPIGGMAGDMFVAAVVDAFPEHEDRLLRALSELELPAGIAPRFEARRSGAIAGRRFVVTTPAAAVAHQHDAAHAGQRCYRGIRNWIESSTLQVEVKRHALALFALLAQAEATVHGIEPEDVHFHEVGAWDSIVDFVAAAWLIAAFGEDRWTWSPLPLGSGRIHSAHGVLPIPAPATALLLRGMAVTDDGIEGERVTPTGAAILKHLSNLGSKSNEIPGAETIAATGFGLGTKRLPGVPNVLRCLALSEAKRSAYALRDQVAWISFEVDDQSPEDLAIGLERLRAIDGVLDVMHSPVFAKKGRMAAQVQVLARPEQLDPVVAACFAETATLGVRQQIVDRSVLERKALTVMGADGASLRVKLARRPDGSASAKAESDDLRAAGDRARREELRRAAEAAAQCEEDEHDR